MIFIFKKACILFQGVVELNHEANIITGLIGVVMKMFRIENVVLGVVLGVYEGITEEDAIQEMLDDAGCVDLPSSDLSAFEEEKMDENGL